MSPTRARPLFGIPFCPGVSAVSRVSLCRRWPPNRNHGVNWIPGHKRAGRLLAGLNQRPTEEGLQRFAADPEVILLEAFSKRRSGQSQDEQDGAGKQLARTRRLAARASCVVESWSSRGTKTGPLGLASLAIVCCPLTIITIIAIITPYRGTRNRVHTAYYHSLFYAHSTIGEACWLAASKIKRKERKIRSA